MNHHISPTRTGLALGTLVGGLHLLWAVLVWIGWAQPLVDFSAWAHMINPPVVVKEFDPSAAVTVVIVAAIVGYLVGVAFARIWNRTHRGG